MKFSVEHQCNNIYIIYFWRAIGLFLVCFTVWENAGMLTTIDLSWTMNTKKKRRTSTVLAEISSH
jgi:hypothetical protein